MSIKKAVLITFALAASSGPALAQPQKPCTQHDIALKYTEIGQLIRAELAGNLSAASTMMDQMHAIQNQFTSGQINSSQFCSEYDALIQEMKFHSTGR